MTALGIALLVIGAVVVVIEAHFPRLGMLGGPGVVALTAGTVLTVAGLGGGIAVAAVVAALVAMAGVALVGLSVVKGAAVSSRRVRGGAAGLVGRVGRVTSWSDESGKVQIDGALWRARRSWGSDEPETIQAGDEVVIERMSGLTLAVRRAEEWELAP